MMNDEVETITAAMLPGQKKTDEIARLAQDDAIKLYARRKSEILRIVRAAADADDLQKRLQELSLDWMGDVGRSLTLFGRDAARAGHEEARRRRKQTADRQETLDTRKTAASRMTEFGGTKIRAAQAELVEGGDLPSLEWDFLQLRSFSIAHVEDARVLQEMKNELGKVLQGGGTYSDFRQKADELLGDSLSDAHGQTIYVTNLQTAYNAGKYYEGMAAADVLPYWQYVTVGDNFVRPAHRLLDGRVWRKDDPVWNTIYPPNGFNCRCSVVEHDNFSLQEEGLKVSRGIPAGGGSDEGFEGNAARDSRIMEALMRQYEVVAKTAEKLALKSLSTKIAPRSAMPSDFPEEDDDIKYSEKRVRYPSSVIRDDEEVACPATSIELLHRDYSPEWRDKIAESIERFGWKGVPIVVEHIEANDYALVTGTHRVMAWKKLGLPLSDIPMITWQEMLTSEQVEEVMELINTEFNPLRVAIRIVAPETAEKYGIQF